MIVLDTLAPLVIIVALGAILRRANFMPAPFFRAINRLVYWFALPCLLFIKTSETTETGDVALRIFLIMLAGTLGAVLLAYVVAAFMKIPRKSVGAFVQGAYRGNLAYVGLAVVLFVLEGADKHLAGAAALALAPLIPIYNFIAVTVLLTGQDRPPKPLLRRVGEMAYRIVTNPLILACAAGLTCAMTGWTVPPVIERTARTLGQMAMPMALLGIGASVALRHFHAAAGATIAAMMIKIAASPLIGLVAASMLEASACERRIALLFLATPTAIASFVMAEQLGADEQLAGSIIVLSTLASTASLAAVLLLA